jgi:hypothetical protein
MSLVVKVSGVAGGGGGHKSQTRNRLDVKVQRPVFGHNKQTWRRDNLTSISISGSTLTGSTSQKYTMNRSRLMEKPWCTED